MRKTFYYILSFFASLFKFYRKKRLRVLAYHNIKDEATFFKQIEHLAQRYNVIDIESLHSHIYNGKSLPDYPLLITFDDGDFSVWEKGILVLEKFGLPSCMFIISGLINSDVNYWADTVRINERNKGKDETEIKRIVKKLKDLPNENRLEIMKTYQPTIKKQLSLKEVKDLINKRMFIGNHSYSHPMFNRCTRTELELELEKTKELFKEWNLEGYSVFAYPNGNYNHTSEKVLEEKNIIMAFLFDHKLNSIKIDPLRISRIRVDSDTPMYEYKVKVSGLHSLLYQIRR